jgi:TolA-binding protein
MTDPATDLAAIQATNRELQMQLHEQLDDLGGGIERVIAERNKLQKQLDITVSALGLIAVNAGDMPRENVAAIATSALEMMERVP